MRWSFRHVSRRGFTLIELLVVIAIIAILAAILFPVFAQARGKARQATCVSNLKQVGLAIHMYAQDYDELMPWSASNVVPATHFSWYQLCEPYVKSGVVRNEDGSLKAVAFYRCPSYDDRTVPMAAGDPVPPAFATAPDPSRSYTANGNLMPSYSSGFGKWFPARQLMSLASINQAAQVVLVSHNSGGRTMAGGDDWTTGCMGTEAGCPEGWNSSFYCAGRFQHNGGSVYLLADGHAKFFKGPSSWRAASLTGVAWRRSLAPNASAWFRED
jgi:prepilin-type N-terminal cleavage/methylation domain-containing protein/prepilin-type processing-associated H-X9-DG protein